MNITEANAIHNLVRGLRIFGPGGPGPGADLTETERRHVAMAAEALVTLTVRASDRLGAGDRLNYFEALALLGGGDAAEVESASAPATGTRGNSAAGLQSIIGGGRL